MSHVDLSGAWFFAYSFTDTPETITGAAAAEGLGLKVYPCVVPGNFELDLIANGLHEGDPFQGMNIVDLRRYEKCHVWYFRSFPSPELNGGRAELTFGGIDCFSEICLNGDRIGTTDNMLIEHVFDVTGRLRAANEVVVHLRPTVEEATKYPYPPTVWSLPHNVEAAYVRKAPHGYGWDIMPRALSAGLWRPVSLHVRAAESVDTLYLANRGVKPDLSSADLVLSYKLRLPEVPPNTYEIQMEARCGDARFETTRPVLFGSGHVSFTVERPQLWWPRGRGAANLYDVQVRLLKHGRMVDQKTFKHGIRSITLDRTTHTDEAGTGRFQFVVNHERVYVHGTNWVPVDAYHSRDAARIPQILALVDDLGCNMIRCWGGNVYEDDVFFDTCDEKGILVWQDFAMACSVYPQDDEFAGRLAVEARAVIKRLRQHPCLALWAGDNECDESWTYAPLPLDPTENVLTRRVLPDVLRQEDPFRPYLPSSPYLSKEVLARGTASMPEAHLWGARENYRSEVYENTWSHFVSEIGFHGCPASSSVKKFLSPEHVWPYWDNPEWTLHATSPIPGAGLFDYRVELMAKMVRNTFGTVPDTLDDFSFASQACQAEGMKHFLEFFRSEKWRRTGVIWWNVMDGWPQFSDAVVDYYFQKKLAYDFIKRAQQPLCVVARERGGVLSLFASNDTRRDELVIYRVEACDTGQGVTEGEFLIPADNAALIERIPLPSGEAACLKIDWHSAAGPGVSHLLCGSPPYDLNTYRRWLDSVYG